MENSYMQASLYQQDEHISPSWRPCWGLLPQVLSCHITPHKTHQTTSNGGSTFSATQKSLRASLVCALLQTEAHTQMPVQALVSESLLKGDGALFMDGKPKGKTSDGQKQWASNFLHAILSQSASLGNTSEYLGTTMGSLKDGGKDKVVARKQTSSSDKSTTSHQFSNALLLHAMLPVRKIQWMDPHVESTFTPSCHPNPKGASTIHH